MTEYANLLQSQQEKRRKKKICLLTREYAVKLPDSRLGRYHIGIIRNFLFLTVAFLAAEQKCKQGCLYFEAGI